MKNRFLLAAWLIVATLVLTSLWAHNLDAVPRPPMAFAIWLDDIYGARNGEEVADLDALYMLTVSFVVVAVFTFLARHIWTRYSRRHTV